jgi:hypothetical protein
MTTIYLISHYAKYDVPEVFKLIVNGKNKKIYNELHVHYTRRINA